jgi:hypothetical protein
VEPAAWLCATCGRNLHEPDATTTTRFDEPTTSKNTKPDFVASAYLFVLLAGSSLAILYVLSESRDKYSDVFTIICTILTGAFWVFYFLNVYFDWSK